MNQHSIITTSDAVFDLFAESYPIWLTAHEITDELPMFRSVQAVRNAIRNMVAEDRIEVRTRENARHSPQEFRAKEV
jgi:hypothetical protein